MEDYILAAVLEEPNEFDPGHERMYLKQLRDVSNPFQRSERKFRKLFRFSRSQGHHIVEVLSAGENNPLNSGTIPAHLKILCAINFMAHGCYQTAVGENSIIAQSQPSVSRSLSAVCSLVLERLLPNAIKFPMTTEEKNKVMQDFQENFGMPNTLGAVDGSHIGIHKPPLNHPTAPGNLFYNRKGFYSVNCQVICDAKGQILSVNPNYPGSTHDAAIWRNSNVNRHLEEQYVRGNRTQWLLGDKGYPLLPWLMTPVVGPETGSPEEAYNKTHASARSVIEMCFGVLKNKFRCLHRHRILHYKPEHAAKIILSCCTFYNLLHWDVDTEENDSSSSDGSEGSEDDRDDDSSTSSSSSSEDSEDDDENPNDPSLGIQEQNFLSAARARRTALIRNYFSR